MSSHDTALPRITIITSTFNCAEALKKTAASIREQTYRNIQWIVADGASRDGTVDVIKENQDIVTDWFSEPDSGIYDAWNKACQLIDGDWVLFLGAGDVLYAADTLWQAVPALEALGEDIVIGYGDVYQFDADVLRYHFGEVDLDSWQIYRPTLPCHQGVFQRGDSLRKEKPFDDSYRVVADSKQMLLALRNKKARYIKVDVSIMDMLGISAHPKSAIKVMHEFFRLENDLDYDIPIAKKLTYITKCHLKFLIFKLTKNNTISRFNQIKKLFH
nr:glycosyltransferase family 2 protein [uncultured Pseudogulbenkiania sp.]